MHRGLKLLSASLLILILIVASYCYWALTKPLPKVTPIINQAVFTPKATTSHLAWPSLGQSAVGVLGTAILDTHNPQTPKPTASTAKLITVLMVLKVKPLQPNQAGPTLTLNANDVAIYNNYVAQSGSVVPVQAGEQISEYQMLEGILLPSANNMADSLAIWAYGSLSAYSLAANNYLHNQLGLKDTTVGVDASGFSPTTTSTAHDLVKIGEEVMQNPVLAGIVNQSSASGLPLAPSIKNVNSLLGSNNIVGVKTGNTDQAGGVFVGAARFLVNDKPTTVVTAVVDAPNLWQAMRDSLPLLQTAQANFIPTPLVKAGSVIANYYLPWQSTPIPAATNQNVSEAVWGGTKANLNQATLSPISYPATSEQVVGQLTSNNPGTSSQNSSQIVLKGSVIKPSIWWRLTHP